jgi:RNA polymerase sigma factor (sigma-70 family)
MELDVMPDACTDDARLVTLGLQGNRDAFAQLVARYQSPLCAIAYSACGNLSDSQDLAQEAFIIAWSKLSDLNDPAKFKSWLYGIARNLLHNSSRRQLRDPLSDAGPLDDNLTTPSANPTEQTITNEEEAILWRSLEQIPVDYREPLVLFYREQQSVQRVAGILNLSEDVIRQRLSRGRKLLQQQVITFIEGTLARTAPSQAFTLSVVSALPRFTTASGASTVAASAAGSGAAKVAFIVALGAAIKAVLFKFVPPIANGWITTIKLPESPRERKFAVLGYAWLWVGAVLYPVALMLSIRAWGRYWDTHPQALTLVILGSAFGFTAIVAPYSFWLAFTQRRIREQEAITSGNTGSISHPYEYRSPFTLLGLPLIHIRFNCVVAGKRLPAVGWIAVGDKAFGILGAIGGIAVGGFSFGGIAIGLFALGGVGVGLFAFGGLSIGGIVMGGAALGYMAMGGGAIGWLGASGGAAVARRFAEGGGVIAPHANDAAARAFMRGSYFFGHQYAIFDILIFFSWLIPPALTLYYKLRRERASRLQSP